MKIDPTKPVKLLRIFRGRTGNIYHPRERAYMPGELPTEAYTSYYVISAEDAPKYNEVDQKSIDTSLLPPVIRDFNQPARKGEVNLKSEVTSAPSPSNSSTKKLPINLLSHEDLKALPSIGDVTANKVISLREEAPFVNYDDLNTRVPLPFNKDWSNYNLTFDSDE